MAINRQRIRRKPMAEINVVPYIDVMLVLLIIFMVTAPMLTQGVKVNLPQVAKTETIGNGGNNSEPLVVSVDSEGLFYVAFGDEQEKPVDAQRMTTIVAAILKRSPKTQIMVKGDTAVDYGAVVTVMVLLKNAGAPSVGLITSQQEAATPKKDK